MRLLLFVAVALLVFARSEAARPRFSTLQRAYPRSPPYDAWRLKRDMGLPDWLYPNGRTPNTCAIRMSKTFHDAGLGINRSRAGRCSSPSAGVNGKGKQYIIRVLFFRCYLKNLWGNPDRTGIRRSSDIRGRKGLLIFFGCSGFGQHIDLWDGNRCSLACDYFHRCSNVEMYYLP